MPPAPVPASDFRRACSQFATGVAIATTSDANGVPHGLTINSFTSVSLAPPLVLICISHHAAVRNHFVDSGHYAVNVLSEHQQALSQRFAVRADQRFLGAEWRPGQTGSPVLSGVIATFECRVQQMVEAGDHTIFVGEVVNVEVNGGRPLLYFNSDYTASR